MASLASNICLGFGFSDFGFKVRLRRIIKKKDRAERYHKSAIRNPQSAICNPKLLLLSNVAECIRYNSDPNYVYFYLNRWGRYNSECDYAGPFVVGVCR